MVELVQDVWAEILTLETIGPDDDFFELGGHSLIVASAVARLGERLGIDLPLHVLFAAPTPAEMATLIDTLLHGPESGQPAIMLQFSPTGSFPCSVRVRVARFSSSRPATAD